MMRNLDKLDRDGGVGEVTYKVEPYNFNRFLAPATIDMSARLC
jgi:hypothetical protein